MITPRDDRLARRGAISAQVVIGLVVTAVGLVLTLDNLGLVDAERYLRFWPAVFVLIGLLKLWRSLRRHTSAFGAFVFLAIGAWLLLEETAVVRVSFRDLWPVLLVFFGGFLLWQGWSIPRNLHAGDAGASVSATAILGSVSRGSNSSAFRGGQLTAMLGGCELDLRQAAIDGEAIVEVFALWGGIELRVPEDWTVESRVTPVLGGVDDQTRPPRTASRHRLVLRGLVLMAGVEIKN
jgi:predicted membrane protein